MKQKLLYLLILISFSACSYTERCEVKSPIDQRTLVFEWVNSLNPNRKGHIKIFEKGDRSSFVAIRPIMDFPINIYWGDTIKVRGSVLVSQPENQKNINWKFDYSLSEQAEVLRDTTKWKHYLLSKIQNGDYK
jgi:RNase P/RNase MRP subunit p29